MINIYTISEEEAITNIVQICTDKSYKTFLKGCYTLGIIDVDKIPDNEIPSFINFWSFYASRIVSSNYFTENDSLLTISIILMCKKAIELSLRNRRDSSHDMPVISMLPFAFAKSRFKKEAPPVKYPIKTVSLFSIHPFVHYVLRVLKTKCNNSDIVLFAIMIMVQENKLEKSFPQIFDMIRSEQILSRDELAEDFKQGIINLTVGHSNFGVSIDRYFSFLMSSFLLNAVFGIKQPCKVYSQGLYMQIIEKSNVIDGKDSSFVNRVIQALAFCGSDSIDPGSLFSIKNTEIALLLVLRSAFDTNSINPNHLVYNNSINPLTYFTALISLSIDGQGVFSVFKELIANHSKQFSGGFHYLKGFNGQITDDLIELVKFSSSGDATSCLQLLQKPECIELLSDTNPYHKAIRVVLLRTAPEEPLVINQLDVYTLSILLNMNQIGKTINAEQYSSIINQLYEIFFNDKNALTDLHLMNYTFYPQNISRHHLKTVSPSMIFLPMRINIVPFCISTIILSTMCIGFPLLELSQDIKGKLILFLNSYYIGKKVFSYLPIDTFSSIKTELLDSWMNNVIVSMPKPETKSKFMELFGNIFEDKSNIDNSCRILEVYLNNNQYQLVKEILQSIHILFKDIVNCINVEVLKNFIEQSIIRSDVEHIIPIINSFIKEHLPDDSKWIYRQLAELSIQYPRDVMTIFRSISKTTSCGQTVLSSIPELPNRMNKLNFAFMQEVLSLFACKKYANKTLCGLLDCLSTEWPEDCSKISTGKKLTIWDEPLEKPQCTFLKTGKAFIDQPWFYCYTCNVVGKYGCCLPCALKCHNGHDIVYNRISQFYCDCIENSKVCHFNSLMNQAPMINNAPVINNVPLNNIAPKPTSIFGKPDTQGIPISAFPGFFNESPPSAFGFGSRFGRTEKSPQPIFGGRGFLSRNPEAFYEDTSVNEPTLSRWGSRPEIPKKPALLTEPQCNPDQQDLIRLCSQLMYSEIEEFEKDNLVTRYSHDIRKHILSSLPTHFSDVLFSFSNNVHDGNNISSPQKRFSPSSAVKTFKKSANKVFSNPSAVIGINNEFIVAYSRGELVLLEKESYSVVSSLRIDFVPFIFAASQLDPCVFAAASETDVQIFSLDENSKIVFTNKIELMLNIIGPNLTVMNIEWVPLAPLNIAVVTKQFVKIYNVPEDCISPITCFIPDNKDLIVSSCFVIYEDSPHCVLSLSSNRIAIQTVSEESYGEIRINGYIQLPIPSQIYNVSYSFEANILFLSGSEYMFYCRPDILIGDQSKFSLNPIKMEKGSFLQFLFLLPQTNSHFVFFDIFHTRLVIIEFTDESIEIHIPCLPQQKPNNVFSFVLFQQNVLMISHHLEVNQMKYGKSLCEPIPIKEEVNDVSNEDDDKPFCVPATFWTQILNDRERAIIEPIGSNEEFDPRSSKSFIFHGDGTKSSIYVRSSDPSFCIVGFRFSVPELPPESDPQIKVFGRSLKIVPNINRLYCIPLKIHEATSKKPIRLTISWKIIQTFEIRDFDVFFYPASQMPQVSSQDNDFINGSTSIFDYVDNEKFNYISDKQWLLCYISLILRQEKTQLPKDIMLKILHSMYEIPGAQDSCRRILFKLEIPHDELLNAWKQVIDEIVENDLCCPEAKPILWRDISVLDKKPSLNCFADQTIDYHAIVAALSFKN